MRITGAQVVDPHQGFTARDLCIQDGKIAAQAGGPEIDAGGCCLIPGLTDLTAAPPAP